MLNSFKTILYPFVEGRNGYEIELSEQHWSEFGNALSRIHKTKVPSGLVDEINQEQYSPQYRELVKSFIQDIDNLTVGDFVALKLIAFLRTKRAEILYLVDRAEELAQVTQNQPLEFILCHSDIHAGNFFIGNDDAFYIVDWDEPIMAPKERDLMYVGGGLLASGRTPQEEVNLFYKAYGKMEINSFALAYYRYERIIEDIAIYCEQLLLTDKGGADREQSFEYLKSNFLPNGTIEIARRSDVTR